MSSPPTIETFKGTNWEECEDFIRAVRAAAWKEGKFRDPGWIADFAALHFARKALSWHSRLPKDVRQDWDKLEVALLDRWTPPEDEAEPRIEPTPAAAPSLNRSDKAKLPLKLVLKLAMDRFDKDCYLRLDPHGRAEVTDDANQALCIRCSSLSNTTLLERTDGSRHSWLAIRWTSSNPSLEKGSISYAYLVFVDSFSLKPSWGTVTPYQLASCTLSTDDEVILVWKNDDTSQITMGIFRDSDGTLCVAADPDAYSKKWSGEKRVKMFIEPID